MKLAAALLLSAAIAAHPAAQGAQGEFAQLLEDLPRDRASLRADPQALRGWVASAADASSPAEARYRIRVLNGLGRLALDVAPQLRELARATDTRVANAAINCLSGLIDHARGTERDAILETLASTHRALPERVRTRMVARAFERSLLPAHAGLEPIRHALQSGNPARIEVALLRLWQGPPERANLLVAELEAVAKLQSLRLTANYRVPDGSELVIRDGHEHAPMVARALDRLVAKALMHHPIALQQHVARLTDPPRPRFEQLEAARALGSFAIANQQTVGALRHASERGDPIVQREVAVSLGLMVHGRPPLRRNQALRRMLHHLARSEHPSVSSVARRVFEQIDG